MGGWSDVPDDLLLRILERINSVGDFIRLQTVCSSWRSALTNKSSSPLPCQQLPWLMLPYSELGKGLCPQNNNQNCCRGIFSISENKVYHIDLPEAASGSRCCGSSHGWLIMVDYTSSSIFLLNPFTKQRIELPPLTGFPDILDFRPDQVGKEYIYRDMWGEEHERSWKELERYHMQKVILSKDPTASDCMVMAICGDVSHLAFCKLGDETWTLIPQLPLWHHSYDDIVFWRNQIYAVDSWGRVVVCDIGVSPPTETLFLQGPPTCIQGSKRYLVVNPWGELLLVVRYHLRDLSYNQQENNDEHDVIENNDEHDEDDNSEDNNLDEDDNSEDNDIGYDDHDEESNDECNEENGNGDGFDYQTSQFYIYKLDEESKNWRKVNGLGDYMLFVGNNRATCLLARDFSKCKGNCVYFADDYFTGHVEGRMGGHDIGIYNFKDKSIEPFPCCSYDTSLIWPPPMWVTPSLLLSQSP